MVEAPTSAIVVPQRVLAGAVVFAYQPVENEGEHVFVVFCEMSTLNRTARVGLIGGLEVVQRWAPEILEVIRTLGSNQGLRTVSIENPDQWIGSGNSDPTMISAGWLPLGLAVGCEIVQMFIAGFEASDQPDLPRPAGSLINETHSSMHLVGRPVVASAPPLVAVPPEQGDEAALLANCCVVRSRGAANR